MYKDNFKVLYFCNMLYTIRIFTVLFIRYPCLLVSQNLPATLQIYTHLSYDEIIFIPNLQNIIFQI